MVGCNSDIKVFIVFKQKTAYEMRISDWSSDVCSSDLIDEVQNVPIRSLEELRMLSNFQFQHRSLLQTLLVGQPQFRSTIGGPELEQLRQREIGRASCRERVCQYV